MTQVRVSLWLKPALRSKKNFEGGITAWQGLFLFNLFGGGNLCYSSDGVFTVQGSNKEVECSLLRVSVSIFIATELNDDYNHEG